MIDGSRVLGLITARGGSKGLPGKNVRDLCGRPLIAWTVDAARRSDAIDDLVVSTDSEEIAAAARQAGAEVPFIRPAALATDTATSIDVVEHALNWLAARDRTYDLLVLLEPTSPLREPGDIDAALRQMLDAGASAVVSVCRADAVHPAFMYRRDSRFRLTPLMPDSATDPRRQDTEAVYFLEGTVYAARIRALLERRTFCHDGTVGYEVPKWKSPEIDDLVDFLLVESIIKSRGTDTWTSNND